MLHCNPEIECISACLVQSQTSFIIAIVGHQMRVTFQVNCVKLDLKCKVSKVNLLKIALIYYLQHSKETKLFSFELQININIVLGQTIMIFLESVQLWWPPKICLFVVGLEPKLYIPSTPNNSNETHTLMCLGRTGHFGQR